MTTRSSDDGGPAELAQSPVTRLLQPQTHRPLWRIVLDARIVAYLSAALGIAAVTAVCAPFAGQVNNTTVALAMLLVVLFVATVWGSWPALLASTLGALAFDYYFLPPFGTFVIGDAQDWIALGAFFVTAVTVGELSARAKRRAAAAETGRTGRTAGERL